MRTTSAWLGPRGGRSDRLTSGTASSAEGLEPCRHEALVYRGHDDFLRLALPALREAVAADRTVLVAVEEPKAGALRKALRGAAVRYLDPAQFGTNPAWLIPAWERLLADHAPPGRPSTVVGEPVRPGRTPQELVECERHEALANVAFAGRDLRLVCLYHAGLDAVVLDGVRRTHPLVCEGGVTAPSDAFPGLAALGAPCAEPLPPPPAGSVIVHVDRSSLGAVRRNVGARARSAGMVVDRVDDLVLVVNELATNAIRHGDGSGELELWTEGGAVVCEVRGRGHIDDPLAGRRAPADPEARDGRGLWITNQLCDLVQIRSFPSGGVVRVSKRLI